MHPKRAQEHSILGKSLSSVGNQQLCTRHQPHLPRAKEGGVLIRIFHASSVTICTYCSRTRARRRDEWPWGGVGVCLAPRSPFVALIVRVPDVHHDSSRPDFRAAVPNTLSLSSDYERDKLRPPFASNPTQAPWASAAVTLPERLNSQDRSALAARAVEPPSSAITCNTACALHTPSTWDANRVVTRLPYTSVVKSSMSRFCPPHDFPNGRKGLVL